MTGCIALVWFVVAGGVVFAQQSVTAPPLVNPVAPAAKSLAAGAQLYRQYCRGCHGDTASGDGPMAPRGGHPPSLSDAVWAHGDTDGEIFANIRDGIGPAFDMKPMKSRMTATDIWNVVNYLRSLATPSTR